jgi:hypothetical protein
MTWERISNRRIQRKSAGFFVIKPENFRDPIPLFCQVCSNQMRNITDSHAHRKYGACFECATKYAEPNREKWEKGWRPNLSRGAS